MRAPSHIVGGFTFTGIFASICGINFLDNWVNLVVIFFASILPDIDHTKSLIGKMFPPVSKFLNRKYGHRTITHSLFLFIPLSLLSFFIQHTFFPSIPFGAIFSFAYFSHLILDMMTIQGVPLFYPFKRNNCVIPADPKMRISTNNVVQEAQVFVFFMVASIALFPLFKKGFWTSYNQTFSTVEHVHSEFNKSDDLLQLSFDIKLFTELKKHEGLLLHMTNSSFYLIEESKINIYSTKSNHIQNIDFSHSNFKIKTNKINLTDATQEDINNIFASMLYKFNITSSELVLMSHQGKQIESNIIDLEFPSNLQALRVPTINQLSAIVFEIYKT